MPEGPQWTGIVVVLIQCHVTHGNRADREQSKIWHRTFFIWYTLIKTHLPVVPQYASVNWISMASGSGLSPVRHQSITWTNTALLPIIPLETTFCKIWIKIQTFFFAKMYLKISSSTTKCYFFPTCCRGLCLGFTLPATVFQYDGVSPAVR